MFEYTSFCSATAALSSSKVGVALVNPAGNVPDSRNSFASLNATCEIWYYDTLDTLCYLPEKKCLYILTVISS